jgi:uncharacterized membrane protein YczE
VTSTPLANLSPVEQLRAGRLTYRVVQLVLGLGLYGVSMGFMIRGALGQMPWDVLHFGLARNLPFTIGQVIIGVSFLVLLLWIPLRQMPGLGTVLNAILVGLATDAVLSVLVAPDSLGVRVGFMVLGIFLNAVATACYIGAQLGPGPRDGLMTGLSRRTGLSIRLVRTTLEVTVVLLGWFLGGVFGVGTVLYALVIGPLTQQFLPWATVPLGRR